MAEHGYSGTPLLGKLGYRDGQRGLLVGLPPEPSELLGFPGFAERTLLPDLAALGMVAGRFDLIHVFEREHAALAAALPGLMARLTPRG